MTVIRSWNWLLSWLVAVWIHLTEATDTVYSFYLQHNMSISAISTRQKIRSSTLFQLRCITTTFACSIVHVLQADSMPLLSETRLHTVISHIVHLHMRTVTYATTVKLSITVNHQHISPVSTAADRRVEAPTSPMPVVAVNSPRLKAPTSWLQQLSILCVFE